MTAVSLAQSQANARPHHDDPLKHERSLSCRLTQRSAQLIILILQGACPLQDLRHILCRLWPLREEMKPHLSQPLIHD